MQLLVTHIKGLYGVADAPVVKRGAEMAVLPHIDNAWLLVEEGCIAAFGPMHQLPPAYASIRNRLDASGRLVLPAWCDSHTHLVFAYSREMEFIEKIKGATYAEIAAKGGGILNSARALQQLTDDQLFNRAWSRLQEAAALGTGAIEIKSGYGLTPESEIRMLRVIRRLQQRSALTIKSTFLGAHAIPDPFRNNKEGYVRQIIEEMLPPIAAEGLADFIDVFCENGFFTPDDLQRICRAAMVYGLKPKVHVNQLSSMGGLQAALQLPALSADHLEVMTPQDVADIAASNTIATLLPTAAFFLRMPFQPARQLLDAGAAVALASDCNPGSSPSLNMNLVVAMACIGMRMLPEEAINAATLNGAFAMQAADVAGSITPGKHANFIVTRPVPSLAYLPYAFGSNLIEQVYIRGQLQPAPQPIAI